MKKKKMITMLAAVSLVAIIGVASTLAYFTDSETVSNVITMGNVDVSLAEPNYAGNDATTAVVPNQTITKDPTITLASTSNDAYVRASLEVKFVNDSNEEITITNADGEDVTDAYEAQVIAACEEKMSASWTKGTDGYYYYNTKLTQSENTAVLFKEVTIPASWGNEVVNAKFQINVTAEAVQADNVSIGTEDTDVIQTNASGNIISWSGITPENYSATVE